MGYSMNSRDYMTEKPVTIGPDADILDAIELLIAHKVSGATVVDEEQRVVGVISELDCLRAVLAGSYHGEVGGRVRDYMTTDVEFADIDADILDVAKQMLERKRRRLPVLKDGKFYGQFSARSILQAILRYPSRYTKKK